MNMLMLVGVASSGGGAGNPAWVDQCALGLFAAGFLFLAVGAYITHKTASMQPVKVHRRLD